MISQQRFEELVELAKKGGLHINEAIKLAVHESLEIERARDVYADAMRYRFLRGQDIDQIKKGGVFAGMTPDNIVLNGTDLDDAIDCAKRKYVPVIGVEYDENWRD